MRGTNTGTLYDMSLTTPEGIPVVISLTCHHTTSLLHLQLNGKKSENLWDKKLYFFSSFVYSTIGGVISKVEKSPQRVEMDRFLRQKLSELSSIQDDSFFDEGIVFEPKVIEPHQDTTSCANIYAYPETETETKVDLNTESSGSSPNMERDNDLSVHNTVIIPVPEELDTTQRTDICIIDEPTPQPNGDTNVRNDEAQKNVIQKDIPLTSAESPLNALRLTLRERNDEIRRLNSDANRYKKLQKDLDEKITELEEKDAKIAKIMSMKEKLGNSLQTLKEKLADAETQNHEYCGTIETQKETIDHQKKCINEISLRTECNQQVATLFMEEVLHTDDDERNPEELQEGYKEQVAKLFNELNEERERTKQLEAA